MSELTDRMRTCAAAIRAIRAGGNPWDTTQVAADAADLLIGAAEALEPAADPLGEPMALPEPVPQEAKALSPGAWMTGLDMLPSAQPGPPVPRPNRVCPKCDSRRFPQTILREGNQMIRRCTVCGNEWPFQ